MKDFYKLVYSILTIILIILSGCKEEPTPGLFSNVPTGPIGASPTITSISPDSAIAGVTPIVISGTNFTSDTSQIFVYFNGMPGKVLSSSPTQINVISANITGKNITVKVAVLGAELFSNQISYILNSAVSIPYKFPDYQKPHGITTDKSGNVYVSVEGDGVKEINTSLELTDYAPKGSETFWSSLKYGQSNIIYGARTSRGVWQIFENTKPTSAPWTITATGSRVDDIDFDNNLNIWTVGGGSNIFIIRITPAGEFKTFRFDGSSFKAIRFFNNSLYVGGSYNNTEGIWEIPVISSDSLGDAKLYFDFSQNYPSAKVNTITFAEDGDLYIGSSMDVDPIIVVHPNKTFEVLYPGLIKAALEDNAEYTGTPDVENFAWGPGNFLYFTQRGLTLVKLDIQKPGAPQYGRD